MECKGLMEGKHMSSTVRQISDAEFQATIAQGVTLVDFWAPWCGPCKMVAPVLDELAVELAGKATIAKLNVDDHPETPGAFGIMSIPTMILFKDGKPVNKLVGALPKAQIQAFVASAL
jgi:thioredoxin 1